MKKKRCIVFLAGCLLLLLAPKAKAAAGEGVQLGPTLLFPVLKVSGTYDDNFYLTSHNPESGWETSIAPSLRIVLPVRRFYLNAEGGLEFLKYYDIDEGDSTDWFVGAAVGADFPGGLSFKVADRHEVTYLPATQEFGAGEDFTQNNLTATVAYAVSASLRLELSGLRKTFTYDLSDDRDRVESSGRAVLYWKFRPEISALFEGAYESFKYDSNTAQDNNSTEVALGVTWEFTTKSTGFAKAGYQWKSYDAQDVSLGTEDGEYYTFSGGLNHAFTPRTVLGVELLHESEESDFPENPYYLTTAFGANLSQRLTEKLYARAGARYSSDKYPNATSYDNPYDDVTGVESGKRTDATINASLSLGFDITHWLVLELLYEGEWRDSTYDTFDYDQNRVTLSAKAVF